MRRYLAVLALVPLLALPVRPAQALGDTYLVGAAVRDISPIGRGVIHTGGYGLGDGSSTLSQLVGAGRTDEFKTEHIGARAVVIEKDGTAIALVTVETQGMFAAYERSTKWGLDDIANRVAAERPGLPASNIVISNDHTHGGPDAIGAWGFLTDSYMDFIADQTVAAIEAAYDARVPATLVAGSDDAPDLIYSQTCTEALDQASIPQTCDPFADTKDSLVRVLQARNASGNVILTLMSYAAHATLGGGNGVHGDWPQFMSERLTSDFGGIGIAMEGTNGRIQPCRPRCFFTDHNQPGYNISDRKVAYTTMLAAHVQTALADAQDVSGPVQAAKTFIRHEVENPFLAALLLQGKTVGAAIERSQQAPWLVGNVVQTVVSAIRVGGVLFNGAPGEPYPNIAEGVSASSGVGAGNHWTLALADDQLGYLMAPVEGYPAIASQAAVNDNPIFNISPTVGDHVMCTQIRLAASIGFSAGLLGTNPRCPAWDAFDLATDSLL